MPEAFPWLKYERSPYRINNTLKNLSDRFRIVMLVVAFALPVRRWLPDPVQKQIRI